MSDDAPGLGLSAQEIHTWTQLVIGLATVSSLARRHLERARLERLAFADAEHAARMYEQSLHPPLRQMNAEEHQAWQRRVPRELAGPHRGEPLTVWTAWMADALGAPTGEWGVEAHSWSPDGHATSSLWVVCRDAEDAIGMQAYLRKFGTAEDLGRLRYLAGVGEGRFMESPQVTGMETVRPRSTSPLPPRWQQNFKQFEAALRALLPAHAEDILHPLSFGEEFDAARELRRLVDNEVRQSGVTPYTLAKAVATVPRWNASEGVRNPSALAIWAIKRVRSSGGYERLAEQSARPGSAPAVEASTSQDAAEKRSAAATRLREVRTVAQAKKWAERLDPRSTEHRIEAKQGFGEWGPEVDAVLAAKFPSLVPQALAAAKKTQDKQAAVVVAVEGKAVDGAVSPAAADSSTVDDAAIRAPEPSAQKLAEMAEWVDTLDPKRGMDKTFARTTLGRSGVEIDRLLAAKFDMVDHETATKKAKEDDAFAIRLTELYPDGLPDPTAEAEAAAWRGRADGDEQQAAAHLTTPDDRHTPEREDVTGAEQAATDHAVAAVHRGISSAVAKRSAVPRQAVAARPPATR
ncbi:hypothetical protein [Lentzea sp. NPDC092896]|uniref:hypothetical protein n=1 Tax=Lentzea sp. NPDC092896 TaxID=3364127 RepID=UPI0038087CCA